MPIRGLGVNREPFIYLDQFMPMDIDWESLHTSVCRGLALSSWEKRFVSSGVHPDWSDLEITPFMKSAEQYLTPEQVSVLRELPTTHERIKFMTCVFPVPHPFWIMYIRNNKRIDPSGISNKSVGRDSAWTESAKLFPEVVALIKQMPFDSIGRVIIFMTEAHNQTVPHYDAANDMQRDSKQNDDFIWFSTAPSTKHVFVMDGETKVKYHPDPTKKFVWFNEMDYHGTDAVPFFSFSIRIDGVFTPEVKRLLA